MKRKPSRNLPAWQVAERLLLAVAKAETGTAKLIQAIAWLLIALWLRHHG